MTDYEFYSQQQLQELSMSDLAFEIADIGLVNTFGARQYFELLVKELKKRENTK